MNDPDMGHKLRIFAKMQRIRRKTNIKMVGNDDNVFFLIENCIITNKSFSLEAYMQTLFPWIPLCAKV